jgi:hypothetical protein
MTTQPDLFLPGSAPAQRHSRTSLDAAKSVEPGSGKDRLRVLLALKAAGSRGLTDEEIQDRLGLPGSTERPRRIELWEKGLVWKSTETRLTRSGRQATIWRA